MMNRNQANRFQPRMNAGLGLLGEAPGMGGQGQMEPVSMGMKRMTGGLLGNAPQQQPRSLMEQNKGARDMRGRKNFRGGQDHHQADRRGFMHEQAAGGYQQEAAQQHQGYHGQEAQQHAGYHAEEAQQYGGYPAEEVQQHGGYTGEEAQQYGGYGAEEAQQYGGYGTEEAQQYGGYGAEEVQQQGGYTGEEAQQYGAYGGEEAQQYGGYGAEESQQQQYGGYPNEEAQPQRGYHAEKVQPRRALLEQPGLKRGLLDKRGSGMEGQGYEAQEEAYYQEEPAQRGLLEEPGQRGFGNTQRRRRGLNEQATYDEQLRVQMLAEQQQANRAFIEDRQPRGILKKSPVRRGGLNDRPAAMARRNEQPAKRGILKRNDGVAGMLERRDRQTELMEKAEVQMRMIQEERQKEEIMKREMMERIKQQEAITQQQLMLKAQLQQQQRQARHNSGDGLLGSGPNRGMQGPGGRQMGRQGDIPSLFDVRTKQTGPTGLGKRSSGSGGQRNNDNKKARLGPPDNRNRSNQRDKQNRRDGNEQRRNGNRSRTSRFDSSSASRSRDRKDSASSRRSTDSHNKTPDRASQVKSPRDSTKAKDTKVKESPKVTPKDAKAKEEPIIIIDDDSKVNEETIKGDTKVVSKDTKVKDENAKEDNKDKVANRKDVKGKLTEVTVTMGDQYDPAEPTGDLADKKDNAEKTEDVVKKEEPVAMETDDAAGDKKEESKKAAEENKPMEISLTVTVNKKGRSVNDSDKAGDTKSPKREKKYKCNLCSIECWDEESFSRHMNGMKHRKKMAQVMSSSSHGVNLLSARQQAEQHLRQIEGQRRGGGPQGKSQPVGKALETHCKICNKKFRGAFRDHKNDPEHKAREDRIKMGCKICKVDSFSEYYELTKHWQSAVHRKNNTRRHSNKEGDEMEELVTLDTVGFEDDLEMSEMNTTDSKSTTGGAKRTDDSKHLTSTPKSSSVRQSKEDLVDSPIPGEYDPEVAVGQTFVIPVTGFFCKLCHKFYNSETTAKGVHCKSLAHYRKYKKVAVTQAYNQKLKEENQAKAQESETPKKATDNKTDSQEETDNKTDSQEETKSVEQVKDSKPEAADETGNQSKIEDSGMDTSETGNQSKLDHSGIEASAYETADEAANLSKVDQNDTQGTADEAGDQNDQTKDNVDDSEMEPSANDAAEEQEGDETVDQSTMDQDEKEASGDEAADEHDDNTENVTMSGDPDDSTVDLTAGADAETASPKRRTTARRGTAQKSPRGRKQTAKRGRKA